MREVKSEARTLPRPGAFAQIGYLRRLFAEPQPVLEELHDRYGPIVGLGAGPVRLAIVGDPTAIADLFAEPTESFRWNHKFNPLRIIVGKASMIVSDGDDHQRRRGAVQTGFSRRRLNGWIPMIVDRTDAAIDGLVASLDEPGQTTDMYPVGRSLVLEIVIRALCGEQLAHRAAEIGDLFQRPQDYLESPALKQLPHPFPFGARAKVKRDRQAFDTIIDDEIARLRTHPDGDDRNMLETLVTAGELSDAEVRDQIASLIGAGYDTTAATLAWLLLRATATPDLWERLRTEADTVFGALSQPDHTSLAGLDLAARTVHESLRLHPAGVVSLRETTTDVSAGGYLIPRHTLIAWSPHLAGQDPHHWPNPLRFDPDRHLDPTPQQTALAKAAWVPFGGGARNCIGFALAQIELTLIVARLAQRLDLTHTNTTTPPAVGMVVNRPQGGAPIHVTQRHTTQPELGPRSPTAARGAPCTPMVGAQASAFPSSKQAL